MTCRETLEHNFTAVIRDMPVVLLEVLVTQLGHELAMRGVPGNGELTTVALRLRRIVNAQGRAAAAER